MMNDLFYPVYDFISIVNALFYLLREKGNVEKIIIFFLASIFAWLDSRKIFFNIVCVNELCAFNFFYLFCITVIDD